MDRDIYEGWTPRDFIEELEPTLDMIQRGESWQKPLTTRAQVEKWTAENQPYYKKPVEEVVDYFCRRYAI